MFSAKLICAKSLGSRLRNKCRVCLAEPGEAIFYKCRIVNLWRDQLIPLDVLICVDLPGDRSLTVFSANLICAKSIGSRLGNKCRVCLPVPGAVISDPFQIRTRRHASVTSRVNVAFFLLKH